MHEFDWWSWWRFFRSVSPSLSFLLICLSRDNQKWNARHPISSAEIKPGGKVYHVIHWAAVPRAQFQPPLFHVTFTSSTWRSCICWRRVLTRHQRSAASQHHDGSLFGYTWDDCGHAFYFLRERALTVVMASKMCPFLPRPCWFYSVPGRQTGASRYQCHSGVCRLGLCFWMILKWKRHQMSLSLVHHD